MKKLKTKCGYIAYEVSREEMAIGLNSPGECDECLAKPPKGYLIPVINRFLCSECFKSFDQRAKFYVSDLEIERKNARYYESKIYLHGEGI